MNPSTLPVADGGVRFGEQVVPVAREALGRADAAEVVLGVRPEDLGPDAAGLPVEVDVVEELGADAYVHGRTEVGGGTHVVTARVDGRRPPLEGDVVRVAPRPGSVHLFRVGDGERIGD